MVAGHLREKRGYYHIVLNYTDETGKRRTPTRSTGLAVKGNKKRAEAMLQAARQELESELERRPEQRAQALADDPSEVPFTAFMLDWLAMMRNSVEYYLCLLRHVH